MLLNGRVWWFERERGSRDRAREADSVREKAEQRLARLSTPEVLNWADQAGSGVAKALDDYRRLGERESLLEAQDGISALAGVLDVLLNRER